MSGRWDTRLLVLFLRSLEEHGVGAATRLPGVRPEVGPIHIMDREV